MAGWTPVWVLVFASVATPVLAQTMAARESPVRQSWAEVGGGLGAVAFLGEGGAAFPTVQARINLLPSASAELAAHFPSGVGSGVYDLRGRFTHIRAASVSPYVTVGALGVFEIRSRREFQNRLATGDVVVHPASKSYRLSAPDALTLGGGASVRFGRLSLEAGGEAWMFRRGVALAMRTALVVGLGPRR